MISALLCAALVAASTMFVRGLNRVPPRRVTAGRRHGTEVSGRRHSAWKPWLEAWRRRLPAGFAGRRARTARRDAWPSVADELAAGLRAGASLRQALDAASGRGGTSGETLRAVLLPATRGDPLPAVARRWVEQASDPDEALLAEAVQLAASTARAESVMFDTVADTIRERAALAGELRAQTAQARASAAALCVLPLVFTGVLALADPSVVTFLVGTMAGWLCLGIGVGLQAGGAWWMHRIVSGVTP